MTPFGYSPGDRVLVFDEHFTRIIRDDLRFEFLRLDGGFFLVDPQGKRTRFTQAGRKYGGGSGRFQRVAKRSEQAQREHAARLHSVRSLATVNVFNHAERLQALAYREIRQGETRNAREHANAIIAALDELDTAKLG